MKRRASAAKPTRIQDAIEVEYSPKHWSLLESLRRKTLNLLESLGPWKESSFVHGSVARGDIDQKSDIDILIPFTVDTQLVETTLEGASFHVSDREISQATPSHSPKAHVYLDPERLVVVTIPMTPLRRMEAEFYRFGGIATLEDVHQGSRNLGCTKSLTLVEPTTRGHIESPVVEHEAEVAGKLGVSVDIVKERVRVLTRRDIVGRTGTFLKLRVPDESTFERVLAEETRTNPALRRTLRARTRC